MQFSDYNCQIGEMNDNQTKKNVHCAMDGYYSINIKTIMDYNVTKRFFLNPSHTFTFKM